MTSFSSPYVETIKPHNMVVFFLLHIFGHVETNQRRKDRDGPDVVATPFH
jgi:hypothetical protein